MALSRYHKVLKSLQSPEANGIDWHSLGINPKYASQAGLNRIQDLKDLTKRYEATLRAHSQELGTKPPPSKDWASYPTVKGCTQEEYQNALHKALRISSNSK